jgi:osmotically-inducible protein OsmY
MPPIEPPGRSQPGSDRTAMARAMIIEDLAEYRLKRSPYSPLAGIRCDYRDGLLTLVGVLPSQYLKQVAQEAVFGLVGVREVDNQIRVATEGTG